MSKRKKKKEAETNEDQQVGTVDKVVAKIYIPASKVYSTLAGYLSKTVFSDDVDVESTGILVDSGDTIWFTFVAELGSLFKLKAFLKQEDAEDILKDVYLDEVIADIDSVNVFIRFGDDLSVLEGVELEFDGSELLG